MIRVAFTDFIFENREAIRLDGCEFSIHGPIRTADEIVAAAAEADVLCMRDQFGRVTREVLERLPDLKLIATRSAGYDHIDVPEAARRGIPVCNVPDYGTEEVADHAIALTLALCRQILPLDREAKQLGWTIRAAERLRRIRELTFGVVGLGRIGTAAALIPASPSPRSPMPAYDQAPIWSPAR